MGRCHALLWQCDPSPHPPFPGLCLGGLLDISVDVPWMMIMSCPGLMACGHLSPEVSKSKYPTPLVLSLGCNPGPSPHQPALPHLLVPCAFLSPLEPCCWRRALPWVRVGPSGLGDCVSPGLPPSFLCRASRGLSHQAGPHIYTFGLATVVGQLEQALRKELSLVHSIVTPAAS